MKKHGNMGRVRALLAGLGLAIAASATLGQTVTVDPGTSYQLIRGYGGFSGAGWIPELTSAQVDTAFGNGPGQVGLSIMRMRIDSSNTKWSLQVASAQRAKANGALLFATPWSPPAAWKTNNNLINGSLLPQYYGDYATHLINFASYMGAANAPLYGVSLANEPDYTPTYESCLWTSDQLITFLRAYGAQFGSLKVIAPESFNFKKTVSDPILNDALAAPQVDVIGGHLYGVSPSDYPLARTKRKEVWMTEHYTDSTNDANLWSAALPVATEVHKSMVANYNAYVWWYIRRSYGLLTEDGAVSKRGYALAQYAKYVRPGFVRIAATEKPYSDVSVTAYKNSAGQLVVVAVNTGTTQRQIVLNVPAGSVASFAKTRTSATYSNAADGAYAVVNGQATATLDPSSVSTFVSQ